MDAMTTLVDAASRAEEGEELNQKVAEADDTLKQILNKNRPGLAPRRSFSLNPVFQRGGETETALRVAPEVFAQSFAEKTRSFVNSRVGNTERDASRIKELGNFHFEGRDKMRLMKEAFDLGYQGYKVKHNEYMTSVSSAPTPRFPESFNPLLNPGSFRSLPPLSNTCRVQEQEKLQLFEDSYRAGYQGQSFEAEPAPWPNIAINSNLPDINENSPWIGGGSPRDFHPAYLKATEIAGSYISNPFGNGVYGRQSKVDLIKTDASRGNSIKIGSPLGRRTTEIGTKDLISRSKYESSEPRHQLKTGRRPLDEAQRRELAGKVFARYHDNFPQWSCPPLETRRSEYIPLKETHPMMGYPSDPGFRSQHMPPVDQSQLDFWGLQRSTMSMPQYAYPPIQQIIPPNFPPTMMPVYAPPPFLFPQPSLGYFTPDTPMSHHPNHFYDPMSLESSRPVLDEESVLRRQLFETQRQLIDVLLAQQVQSRPPSTQVVPQSCNEDRGVNESHHLEHPSAVSNHSIYQKRCHKPVVCKPPPIVCPSYHPEQETHEDHCAGDHSNRGLTREQLEKIEACAAEIKIPRVNIPVTAMTQRLGYEAVPQKIHCSQAASHAHLGRAMIVHEPGCGHIDAHGHHERARPADNVRQAEHVHEGCHVNGHEHVHEGGHVNGHEHVHEGGHVNGHVHPHEHVVNTCTRQESANQAHQLLDANWVNQVLHQMQKEADLKQVRPPPEKAHRPVDRRVAALVSDDAIKDATLKRLRDHLFTSGDPNFQPFSKGDTGCGIPCSARRSPRGEDLIRSSFFDTLFAVLKLAPHHGVELKEMDCMEMLECFNYNHQLTCSASQCGEPSPEYFNLLINLCQLTEISEEEALEVIGESFRNQSHSHKIAFDECCIKWAHIVHHKFRVRESVVAAMKKSGNARCHRCISFTPGPLAILKRLIKQHPDYKLVLHLLRQHSDDQACRDLLHSIEADGHAAAASDGAKTGAIQDNNVKPGKAIIW